MEQCVVKHSIYGKQGTFAESLPHAKGPQNLQRLNVDHSLCECSVLSQKVLNKKLCVTYQLPVQLS